MQSTQDLREAERIIDALKRGESVNFEGVRCLPAEIAGAETGGWLVLSPERATYLKLSKNKAMAIENPSAELLQAALFAPALTPPPAARPATRTEELALKLVRRAGFLPAAFLHKTLETGALALSTAQAETYFTAPPPPLTRLPEAHLPLRAAEHTRVIPFRAEGVTHLALLIGQPENMDAPLTRLHSSCLTGDLLGSLRCDCGDQLQLALARIAESGGGVLLYLDQEGRGIGLGNKLRAYGLQDGGCDTVEANLQLGFGSDERDFSLAADMLKALGIMRIRLLTNNPAKVEALEQAGITITERLALSPDETEHNQHYLATKRRKLSHYD